MYEKVICKKRAVTLGELLIVFIIMGIVATMTIMSASPTEKSLKYAYLQAINVLGIAYYNSGLELPNTLDTSNMDETFPTSQKNMCLMLTEFINTAENNCNTVTISNSIDVNTPNATMGNPHFKASNGVWYWMGKVGSKGFATIQLKDSDNTSKTVRYHVVIADLNGSLAPNSTSSTNRNNADRVAFIITEDAEVIPLGNPEINAKYLTAKVAYSSASGVETEDQDISSSMTYYEAKRTAWATAAGANNIYRYNEELMSFTFYQGGQGVTGGDTISTNSPYYLNYSTIDSSLTNITHSSNCDTELSDGSVILDPSACYVKITEYN